MPFDINQYELVVRTVATKGAAKKPRKACEPYISLCPKHGKIIFNRAAVAAMHFDQVAIDVTPEMMRESGWGINQNYKRPNSQATVKTALLRIARHKKKPHDFILTLAPFVPVSEDMPFTEYFVLRHPEGASTATITARELTSTLHAPTPNAVLRGNIKTMFESNGCVVARAKDFVWSSRGTLVAPTTDEYEEPEYENLPPPSL